MIDIKTVYIIGCGMAKDTMTIEAVKAMESSDILIGSDRLLKELSRKGQKTYINYNAEEIANFIEVTNANTFAVLTSGDIGFYSLGSILAQKLKRVALELLPGISTVNYFFAKCALPWQDAKLISAHGRETNVVEAVRRNALTFILTANNTKQIADQLITTGFSELSVMVGENLGMFNEKINETTVYKLKKMSTAPLTVLLIANPEYDTSYKIGMDDSLFIRTDVPMTKSVVRAVVMSKLGLSKESICYDVGCGTGSVTVEMALLAYEGAVFSFDKNSEAVELTRRNCKHFQIGNVTVANAVAPKAFEQITPPDCAFVGGSSGQINEIIQGLYAKNSNVKIAINAISPQSATAAIGALEAIGVEAEVMQVQVSSGSKVAGIHMMKAENPVYIIVGGGSNKTNSNIRSKQWFR